MTRDFELSDVVVSSSGLTDEIRTFLDEHHYAGFGRSSSKLFVARFDGELVGVAKFAPPVRQGIAGSIGVGRGEALELDRFCIHPAFHKKNFATHLMGRVVRKVRGAFPKVRKLVSFADPRFGHVGTLYRASNWTEVGKTGRGYHYVDRNEKEINKKTLYEFAKKRGLTERQCFESMGLRRVYTPPKIKYVYVLRNDVRDHHPVPSGRSGRAGPDPC